MVNTETEDNSCENFQIITSVCLFGNLVSHCGSFSTDKNTKRLDVLVHLIEKNYILIHKLVNKTLRL